MKRIIISQEALPIQNETNAGKVVAVLLALTALGLLIAHFVQQENKAKETEQKKVPEHKIKTQAIPNGS
ncbi:hypothetical protein [Parvicella tangerina]|uniref:Uncharacterized protein n=1 Tax=Parvicella tangerina TaxID=2829795 RepID=A0A916JMQ5_9FLAO|nr:hypothetical protein [Parvicella tangerina]CAG5082198.1 hypothetical protein CRYO30217_01837 [Parvicella tangerina]